MHFFNKSSVSLSLTNTLSLSHTHTLSLTHTHSLSHTRTRTLTHALLQCIIFLLVRSPRLSSLLTNQDIREALARLHFPSYVDQDALFDETRNCDYSHSVGGVSRERFVVYYLTFIRECVSQQGLDVSCSIYLYLFLYLSICLSLISLSSICLCLSQM